MEGDSGALYPNKTARRCCGGRCRSNLVVLKFKRAAPSSSPPRAEGTKGAVRHSGGGVPKMESSISRPKGEAFAGAQAPPARRGAHMQMRSRRASLRVSSAPSGREQQAQTTGREGGKSGAIMRMRTRCSVPSTGGRRKQGPRAKLGPLLLASLFYPLSFFFVTQPNPPFWFWHLCACVCVENTLPSRGWVLALIFIILIHTCR